MKTWRKRTGKKKLNEPDEFQSFTQKALDYFKANTNKVYIALGIIAVAVAAAILVGVYTETSRKYVAVKVAEGLSYYDVNSPVPGKTPMSPADRIKKARDIFKDVTEKNGGTRGAVIAAYYKANSDMELGEADNAIKEYSDLISKNQDNPVLVSLARNRLAAAYLAKGNAQESVNTYMAIIKAEPGYMKDEALFNLGALYEATGKPSQAVTEYSKLVKDYPGSQYAADAKAGLTRLGVNVEPAQPQAQAPAPK